jgi:heptosyltransferase I
VVLDLQGLLRSAGLGLLCRSDLRIARAGQREGAHLVSFGARLPPGRLHAVEEYLHLASLLGACVEPVIFALPVRPDAAARAADMLLERHVRRDSPVIVINPSASRAWKDWASGDWARVADALAARAAVVLIGGAARISRHARIAGMMRRRSIDLTGRTTLDEVVALLDRASLHVAPDTGTVHIAAALGTPVVAVFGPTRPWRVGPFDQSDSVVCHGELCGRGCPAYCVRRRRCLRAVTPEEIIGKALVTLDRVAAAGTGMDRRRGGRP